MDLSIKSSFITTDWTDCLITVNKAQVCFSILPSLVSKTQMIQLPNLEGPFHCYPVENHNLELKGADSGAQAPQTSYFRKYQLEFI